MKGMPQLPPPPEGYIERVDGDGNHYYAPLQAQLEKENQQALLQKLQTENAVLCEQQAQSDLVAVTAFEAQLATDAAIVSIFEKISTTTGGTTV